VNPNARMRDLATDMFFATVRGEWGYAQMRAMDVLACPTERISSDQLAVLPFAKLAALVEDLMVKHLGTHKREVLELFVKYLGALEGTAADAAQCVKRAVADVLRELHLAPSILLTSLGELVRWLRGEISLAAAALSAGVRWGLKTVALWAARSLAVLTGANFIIASLFIVGAVFLALQLARVVLGY
jgi:hypothetical protein